MNFIKNCKLEYFKASIYNKIYERLKKKLRNCKIKNKILIGFGIIMIINIICILCLLCNLVLVSYKMNNLYNGAFRNVETILSARVSLVKIDRYMYKAISEEDIGKINKYLNYADEEEKKLKNTFTICEEFSDEFEEKLKALFNKRQEICISLNKGDKYEARTILNSGYKNMEEECEKNISEIYDLSKKSAEELINNSIIIRNFSFVISLIIVITCILLAGIISRVIICLLLEGIDYVIEICSNLLNGNLEVNKLYECEDEMGMMGRNLRGTIEVLEGYIENISYVLKEICQGNLNVKMEMNYKGDFSQIQYSLENIVNTLKGAFLNINCAANIVLSTSKEMEMTSEGLSQGAHEQSKAIEYAVDGIMYISEEIKSNTKNLIDIDEFFNKTIEHVNGEKEKMNNLMNEMKNISNSVIQVRAITDSIQAISRQTDLVALNAAIESARTKVNGRGFAVVAEEIRKLANASSKAVENTEKIIDSCISKINNMNIQAEDVKDGLFHLINEINNVSRNIKCITEQSKGQLNYMNKITDRIEDIDNVTKSNLKMIEKYQHSVNELVMQAVSLEEQIRLFNY